MAATFKSIAMMRSVLEGIRRRLPTYVYTQSFDSNGNPLLLVSADATPATTEQVAMIRISPVTNVFLNSVGGTQEGFCPHLVELCLEATAASASVSLLTDVNKTAIWGELLKQAGIFTLYLTAAGTVPALASVGTQMVAANQVAVFEIDPSQRLAAS